MASTAALTAFFLISNAGSPGAPVARLSYHAPASCPSAAEFEREVLERAPDLHIASESRPVRRFIARVQLAATRVRGTLSIVEPDGRKALREVEAEDCAQVVQALALIVVVLADVKFEEVARGELSSSTARER